MIKKKMELLKSKTGLNETLNDLGNVICSVMGLTVYTGRIPETERKIQYSSIDHEYSEIFRPMAKNVH